MPGPIWPPTVGDVASSHGHIFMSKLNNVSECIRCADTWPDAFPLHCLQNCQAFVSSAQKTHALPTPPVAAPAPPMHARAITDEIPMLDFVMPVNKLPTCECGSKKAVGAKDFGPGHSAWCPVRESK